MNMSIRQFFFQLSSGCSTFPIHWGSHIHLKCFLNKFPNGTWPMSWTVRLTRLKSTWSQYVLLFKWTMTIPLLSTSWESEMQLIPILSVGTLHTRPFIWDGLPFGITEAFLNKILLEIRILLNWRKLKSPTDKKVIWTYSLTGLKSLTGLFIFKKNCWVFILWTIANGTSVII